MMQNDEAVRERKRLLVLAMVGLLLVLCLAYLVNRDHGARYRSDIYLRWYATRKLLSEDRNLYASQNGEEVTRKAYGSPWNTNFFYPAYLLILTIPLALLPYSLAHLFWTIAIQLFYLVGLWLLVRLNSWPSATNKVTFLFFLLVVFVPHLRHTIWGQFNTIAVISLVLCYLALYRGKYGLAGIWASGLLFKPHLTTLALAFLLIWSLLRRDRWRFWLGFIVTMSALWLIAEWFQPGWFASFFQVLGTYGPEKPITDTLWNPQLFIALILALAALVFAIRQEQATAQSPAFAGCLCLTLATWSLVIPALGFGGILHTVVLPLASVLLLANLKELHPKLYRYALWSLLLVYGLGLVGFGLDLAAHRFFWSNVAYTLAAPILIALFSIALCARAPRRAAGVRL